MLSKIFNLILVSSQVIVSVTCAQLFSENITAVSSAYN